MAKWTTILLLVSGTVLAQELELPKEKPAAQLDLGKCYEVKRDFELARASFRVAKDEDICPLRMLEPMHEVVLRVAGDTQATLVDARRLIAYLAARSILVYCLLLRYLRSVV